MKNPIRFFAGVVFWSLSGCLLAASGDLKFKNDVRSLKMKPAQDSITTSFEFTNAGKTNISITGIETSCGCTTAAAEKNDYGSGESGEIGIIFSAGSMEGHVTKSVRVSTSEPATYTLILNIDVPILVAFEPKYLVWSGHYISQSKSLQIVGYPQAKLELVKTNDPSDLFRVEPKKEGEKWTLLIAPKTTALGVTSDLSLDLMVEGKPVHRKLLLRILADPEKVDPLPHSGS